MADGPFQLSKPFCSRHQVTEDQHLPFIADEGKRRFHRAGLSLIHILLIASGSLLQQGNDLAAVLRIEVARRLVGKDQRRAGAVSYTHLQSFAQKSKFTQITCWEVLLKKPHLIPCVALTDRLFTESFLMSQCNCSSMLHAYPV